MSLEYLIALALYDISDNLLSRLDPDERATRPILIIERNDPEISARWFSYGSVSFDFIQVVIDCVRNRLPETRTVAGEIVSAVMRGDEILPGFTITVPHKHLMVGLREKQIWKKPMT